MRKENELIECWEDELLLALLLLTRSPQRAAQPAPAKVAPSAHKWQGPPQQTLTPERRT